MILQEIALYTLEDQPLYKSAKALLAASDFAIKEAKSGFLPSVRLGYLAQDFGTGYHFRGFETGLTIPVWGMFNEKGRVEQAKSIYNERLWDQKSIELNIKEKIELAWHSYDNSQITIQLYQTQLKNKSEKLLALTQEAYRLGQIDLLKMIEAQQLYLSSQEKYLSALRDYYLRHSCRIAKIGHFDVPESRKDQLFGKPDFGVGRDKYFFVLETVSDGDVAYGYFFWIVHGVNVLIC